MIYFAPLSSSFPPGPSTRSHSRSGSTASFHGAPEPQSRKEWIRQWTDEHGISSTPDDPDPVGPRPVSAKAIYRLADKLDLPALRLRAYQHICSELTSQNIPAEVFSRFSSTFDEVRKVSSASMTRSRENLTSDYRSRLHSSSSTGQISRSQRR